MYSNTRTSRAGSYTATLRRSIVLSVLAPLLILVVVSVIYFFHQFEHQVRRGNTEVATVLAELLAVSMGQAQDRLGQLRDYLADHKVASSELQVVLESMVAGRSLLSEVRILDNEGYVRMVAPDSEEIMETDMSGEPFFRAALGREGFVWSGAYLSPYTGLPAASLAVGVPGGVLVANLDLRVLRKTVERLHLESGATLAVLDAGGTYIMHPDAGRVMRREWHAHGDWLHDVPGGKVTQRVLEGADGRQFVTATRIANTGWVVMVYQGEDSVLAPIRKLVLVYGLASFLLVGLGVAMALGLTRVTLFHFGRMLSNIRLVAGGEYGNLTMAGGSFREFQEVNQSLATMAGDIRAREEQIRELNEELQARVAEAESANTAKSEFLANMSHELRTPLNGAMGMLQLLRMTSPTPTQAEYVHVALAACRNLATLLSDILDLSRVEAGRMPMAREPFSLRAMLSEVLGIFGPTAEEKSLTLESYMDPAVPDVVLGDAIRFKQVLFNLVGNAVKFTDQGQVCVEGYPLPGVSPGQVRVLFRVKDTGVGISADQQQVIFEPFTQGDGSYTRAHQGAGLGLSIVKRLVAGMGGNVSLDSEVGEGTAVYFCLTLGRVEQDTAVSHDREEIYGLAQEPDLAGKRVLVVEDDPVNRLAMQRVLEKSGMEVVCAGDGREGLDVLQSADRFDCVLMDIQMPVMDGVDAIQAIRMDKGGLARTPVIALTAYAMDGDRMRFMDAGADAYLAKPVVMEELLRTIGRVLDPH